MIAAEDMTGEQTGGSLVRKVGVELNMLLRLLTDFRQSLAVARDETGQGLTEYALILALVAVVAIAALVLLGGDISSFLSSVAGQV